MIRGRNKSRSRLFALGARRFVALLTVVAATLCALCVARGDESAPTPEVREPGRIEEVSVGIAGVYKNGFQTRVVVSFCPEETRKALSVELETRDSDGSPFVKRCRLTSEERKLGKMERVFVFPKATADLTVRVDGDGDALDERVLAPGERDEEGIATEFDAPANPSRPIFLIVGDEKAGFADAFAELRLKEDRRPDVVKIESLESLPTDFRAYEAIDRLFLTTTDVSLYEGYRADSPQFVAIERWVEAGGNVVIFAGADSVELLDKDGALAALSPGATVMPKTHEFRAVNALTNDLQNVKNLVMTGSRSNPFLRAPVISELKEGANVEMREAETPLLVSRAVGLGTTIYFAADLAAAPIANWSGRGRLLLKILGIDPDAARSKEGAVNAVKRGYVDYSGQIRSALDRFADARPAPFALVAILLLAYVIAIAPIDWFLVKKVLKRPVATWATFPVWIFVFIALAVGLIRAHTPKEEEFNQLDLIDVDMETGVARELSWIGAYSPVGNRYDLSVVPELTGLRLEEGAVVDASPLPLSGAGLGGSEQTTYLPRLWNEPYEVENGSVRSVPMATRSSKSFSARWIGRVSDLPKVRELSDDSLSLRGSIYNPFPFPLYSARVVYQGGALALGTLPPGETKIERGAARMEPMRVVNEQRDSVPSSSAATWDATTYNSASVRLPYILRCASFYDFAGGVENFGIEKRLQRDVDLSALLRCGRAVVYGVVVDPDCEEYKPTEDAARLSADAIEMERLNRKIAEQNGEEYRDVKAETLEKYGYYGTSPSFKSSDVVLSRARGDDASAKTAAKRTVVARLIVPIRFGAHDER